MYHLNILNSNYDIYQPNLKINKENNNIIKNESEEQDLFNKKTYMNNNNIINETRIIKS